MSMASPPRSPVPYHEGRPGPPAPSTTDQPEYRPSSGPQRGSVGRGAPRSPHPAPGSDPTINHRTDSSGSPAIIDHGGLRGTPRPDGTPSPGVTFSTDDALNPSNNQPSTSHLPTALIIGVAATALVFLIIGVIVFVVCKKRKSVNKPVRKDPHLSQAVDNPNYEEDHQAVSKGAAKGNLKAKKITHGRIQECGARQSMGNRGGVRHDGGSYDNVTGIPVTPPGHPGSLTGQSDYQYIEPLAPPSYESIAPPAYEQPVMVAERNQYETLRRNGVTVQHDYQALNPSPHASRSSHPRQDASLLRPEVSHPRPEVSNPRPHVSHPATQLAAIMNAGIPKTQKGTETRNPSYGLNLPGSKAVPSSLEEKHTRNPLYGVSVPGLAENRPRGEVPLVEQNMSTSLPVEEYLKPTSHRYLQLVDNSGSDDTQTDLAVYCSI